MKYFVTILLFIVTSSFTQQQYSTNRNQQNNSTYPQKTNTTTPQSTNQKPIVNSTSQSTAQKPIVNSTSQSTAQKPIVNSTSQNTAQKPIINSTSQNTAQKPIVNSTSQSTAQKPIVNSTPQSTVTNTTEPNKNNDLSTKENSTKKSSALDNYFNGNENTTETTTTVNEPELPSAWGPFFFLTCIIIAIYLTIKWVKKRMLKLKIENNPVDFIRTVATVPVTNNAQLAIIDMAGKYYLFSITTYQMEMITEIKDLDLIFKIQSIPQQGEAKPFKDIFMEIFGRRSSQKVTPTSSEDRLKQLIEKQKDRLGNMR